MGHVHKKLLFFFCSTFDFWPKAQSNSIQLQHCVRFHALPDGQPRKKSRKSVDFYKRRKRGLKGAVIMLTCVKCRYASPAVPCRLDIVLPCKAWPLLPCIRGRELWFLQIHIHSLFLNPLPLLQHTEFKQSAHQQAPETPETIIISWIRCVGSREGSKTWQDMALAELEFPTLGLYHTHNIYPAGCVTKNIIAYKPQAPHKAAAGAEG